MVNCFHPFKSGTGRCFICDRTKQFKVSYGGFLQEIVRVFKSREEADLWVKMAGKQKEALITEVST